MVFDWRRLTGWLLQGTRKSQSRDRYMMTFSYIFRVLFSVRKGSRVITPISVLLCIRLVPVVITYEDRCHTH